MPPTPMQPSASIIQQLNELQDWLLDMDRRILRLVARAGKAKYALEPKPWKDRKALPTLSIEDLEL